ncbi:DNA helicase PIF1, ATP-dependent, partial [Tanacetum coccineum]
MSKGSWNKRTETPSLANILNKSVFIHSNTIINQDGKVHGFCGLKITDIDMACPGTSMVPSNTGVGLRHTSTSSTSRQPFGRTEMRITGVPVSYHRLGPPTYQCSNCRAYMWYEVQLLKFHGAPPPLNNLLDYTDPMTSRFRDKIRVHNSMFCFTSFGACIDHSINTGRGLYTFRINGRNYHRIGSLLPKGVQPRYAQLYFFNTENEVRNQMSAFIFKDTTEGVEPSIVQRLIEMLNQSSSIAKAFRMARDWCRAHSPSHVEVKLFGDRTKARQYNKPTVSEVAALITNDFGDYIPTRDIIGTTLLRGGRLFQQYLVDAYTTVEDQRLKWTRNNQDTLRVDLNQHHGKRIVLPKTFTGGPRYMMQNYQDAMALCRTLTGKVQWVTT